MKLLSIITSVTMALVLYGCAGTMPQNPVGASAVGLPPANSGISQAAGIGSAAGMAGGLAGVVPGSSQTPALVGLLVQQLGISPQQAMGGAGSIFSVARQAMSPTNFGLVSNAVPGMSQLLAAAPRMAGSPMGGDLMGSAANALGGSSLGQMAMMANAFQSLGLGSGMVNQFIPVILQYVQAQGGSSTMGLLQSALMP